MFPGGPSVYQLAEASEKKKGRGRPRKDPELAAAQSEVKTLRQDLRRKNATLAEQTALAVLQKSQGTLGARTRTMSK